MNTPRRATLDDVHQIAHLHATCIHEGFLVTLGPAFLQRLYGRVVRSERSFALVVDDEQGVFGFIAVTEALGAFYRDFVLHDAVIAGLVAVPQIVRAPRHVFETLRYGTRRGAVDLPRAEILAVAVDDRAQGRGAGGALAAGAVSELSRRGLSSARVITAVGNEAAIKTYERAGFRRHGTDAVHRGVTQEVLVWP